MGNRKNNKKPKDNQAPSAKTDAVESASTEQNVDSAKDQSTDEDQSTGTSESTNAESNADGVDVIVHGDETMHISQEVLDAIAEDSVVKLAELLKDPETEAQFKHEIKVKHGDEFSDEDFEILKAGILKEADKYIEEIENDRKEDVKTNNDESITGSQLNDLSLSDDDCVEVTGKVNMVLSSGNSLVIGKKTTIFRTEFEALSKDKRQLKDKRLFK